MTRTIGERRDGRREVAGLVREIQQLTTERRRLRAPLQPDGGLAVHGPACMLNT
jgi:hypothetical protein